MELRWIARCWIFQSVGAGALVGGPKGAVAAGLVFIRSAAVQAGGDEARFALKSAS